MARLTLKGIQCIPLMISDLETGPDQHCRIPINDVTKDKAEVDSEMALLVFGDSSSIPLCNRILQRPNTDSKVMLTKAEIERCRQIRSLVEGQ